MHRVGNGEFEVVRKPGAVRETGALERLINFIGWLGASLFALCVLLLLGATAAVVHDRYCGQPDRNIKFYHLSLIRKIASEQLAATGRVSDIDAMFRHEEEKRDHSKDYLNHPYIFINEYRVVTRSINGGYEVTIEPRRWCFCRPSYVVAVPLHR